LISCFFIVISRFLRVQLKSTKYKILSISVKLEDLISDCKLTVIFRKAIIEGIKMSLWPRKKGTIKFFEEAPVILLTEFTNL
jgi:hypothetical protein